jgi:hypothetical protein
VHQYWLAIHVWLCWNQFTGFASSATDVVGRVNFPLVGCTFVTASPTLVLLAHAQDMLHCGFQYDILDNQPSTGPTTRMVTQSMSIAVPPYHNRLTRLGTG